MEIKISGSTGFCFGVKQAVSLSENALSKKNGRIYSIGPIIHNSQVVERLKSNGLTPIENADNIKEGTIIVSSHGAGAKLKDTIKESAGLKIIDATCPFVKKIQERTKALYNKGYKVVIVGKAEHPEVKALKGFTAGEAIVIKNREEAVNAEIKELRVGVVSQSTYSQEAFMEIVSILLEKPFSELRVFNTICKDTLKRQDSAKGLANSVDAMVVVGGKNSANTRRLVEVCKSNGRETYHIEDSTELDNSWFRGKESVGIASGASTPDWVVQEVINTIRRYR